LDRINRIIRINENHVNPVNPVREVPPEAAKFICVEALMQKSGAARVTTAFVKNYTFQFYNNLPKRRRPWLSPELTGYVIIDYDDFS